MPYIGNIVQDFSVNTAMLNTDSVTSIKIDDGTIVNADINDSAAIAGTKISPDFGSQNITTTGIVKIADGAVSAPALAFTSELVIERANLLIAIAALSFISAFTIVPSSILMLVTLSVLSIALLTLKSCTIFPI